MSLPAKPAVKNSFHWEKPGTGIFCRWIFALGCLIAGLLIVPFPSFAATTTVTPLTWNIIGLDSNTPNFGPNRFPIGARVCSSTAATNVPVTLDWDSINPYVDLRSGSLNPVIIPAISAGGCADAYFEVEVQRNALAFDTTRRFHISSSGVSSPTPRELYVEHLVSQARNAIVTMRMSGTQAGLDTAANIAEGGGLALVKDQTYWIRMTSYTATQGYEQLESFVTFPNTIFQVLSVSTTYTADTTSNVSSPNDKLYGDACSWENDLNSPNYLACNGDGKIGGTTNVDYQVKILSVGGGREPLNSLIYDFSGSSFHYNSDYSTGGRYAYLIDPAAVTIDKKFGPNPTNAGGVSTLTFTLTNPNNAAISGVNFIDSLPASPAQMLVATTPNATTSGCGTPTFAPLAGATSLSFSNSTIAANSTCTVKVNITPPATGSYLNTTGPLYVDNSIDTGKVATDTLVANNSPPAATPACGLTLASWTVPVGSANPPVATKASDVATATAAAFVPGSTAIANSGHLDTASWSTYGYKSAGQYLDFTVDTSKYTSVNVSFYLANPSDANGPTSLAIFYNKGSGFTPHPVPTYTLPQSKDGFVLYSIDFTNLTSTTGMTTFRISATGAKNDAIGASLHFDDIVFTGCGLPLPPTLSKSFTTNPVAVGGGSPLAFIVTNPNAQLALSNLSFTDTLPTGLTINGGTSSQCGGTLTTTAPNTISFDGGTLAANTSCTITTPVGTPVIAGTAGPHNNVSGYVSGQYSGTTYTNITATGVATASLLALAAPSISKGFSPNPIMAGGTSTLTFVISNPNPADDLVGVNFSDTFPSVGSGAPGDMIVATPAVYSTENCGTPTFTPVAGAGSITFTGGTVTQGVLCKVHVAVTAPTATPLPPLPAKHYDNTSGNVSHTLGGTWNGNTATDRLWVETPTPGIALVKEVGPTAAGPWTSFLATLPGATVYYHYTVENYGDIALTAVTVSDADPLVSTASCNWANLPVAVAGNDNHIVECTSSAFSASSGSWQYTSTTTGTAGAATVTDNSRARYATASLSVVKSATQNHFKIAGDVLNYSFAVTNSGSAPLPGPITVADNKASDESCPNVYTIGDFDNYFEPGETLTCTASYTVTAADVTAKLVTNTASASGGGFTSAAVSKTVPLAPDLSVTKTNNVSGRTSDSGTFAWTLTVANAPTAGSATFADGQILLQDDLPDSGANYSVPATATNSAGTTGTIACAIVANTLTCTASGGAVTIPPGESFSIAVTVNVTAAIVLVNPRTPGLCQVDPTPVITEIDETNNSCTDTVSAAMPSLLVVKSAQPYSDPINGTNSPKTIPGAFVTYTIQVINSGPGTVDADTTVITDPIPANTELFVGDIDGAGLATGPILFTDGATSSGLNYSFTSLDNITDNLVFSDINGEMIPVPPFNNDCDPTVTSIRIPLSGTFNGSDGTNHPSFSIKFRVRIK